MHGGEISRRYNEQYRVEWYKLISVFDAVSDTSVKVYPGDELYRVL